MIRRALIVVPALLAATLTWWLAPWKAEEAVPERTQPAARMNAEPPALAAASEQQAVAGARTRGEVTGPASTGKPPRTASARTAEVPGIQPVADLYLSPTLSGGDWDFAAYRSATANADTVGPETAYAAFDFLKSCIGVPQTESDFEMRVEQYNVLVEQSRRRISKGRFERIMKDLQSGYLRCGGLNDTDLVASAAEWLQLAADLGHLSAQILFYRELPDLLRRAPGRIFREPHYLDLHREKSIDYFQRALATGHPQAFLTMAEAILEDVLFEPDLTAAYAHLHAGDLAAAGALPEIGERLAMLESRMTAGDLVYAREWGRQLCRQWCKREAPRR